MEFQFDDFESKEEYEERKEQKKLLGSYTKKQKEKLFLSLNSCPHCGKKIWID